MLLDLLEAIRPREWTKNLFVLAPLVFAKRIGDLAALHVALGTLAAFCLLASAVYLLNDLLDLPLDRLHPEKKDRPIAAGRISRRAAGAFALLFAAGGLGFGALLDPAFPSAFSGFLLAYLALNAAYSLALKRVVVLDAICVAGGFLLRIHAGGAAIDAPVSHWLSLCTLFVALLLALSKRRAELARMGEDSSRHRHALAHYSPEFLDQLMSWLSACTILSYAIYTISPETVAKFGTDDLWWTVPFVVYGIARYSYLVHRREGGGNPTRTMLRDAPFVANALLWAAVAIALIYLGGDGAGP